MGMRLPVGALKDKFQHLVEHFNISFEYFTSTFQQLNARVHLSLETDWGIGISVQLSPEINNNLSPWQIGSIYS